MSKPELTYTEQENGSVFSDQLQGNGYPVVLICKFFRKGTAGERVACYGLSVSGAPGGIFSDVENAKSEAKAMYETEGE